MSILTMAIVTIGYAGLLMLIGIGGYIATHMQHPTALIPVAFGVVVEMLGAVTLVNEKRRPEFKKENLSKHLMHAAAMVGCLGFLGTASALVHLPALLTGGVVERPAAVIAKSAMALASAIYLALCVKSFRDARHRREAASTGAISKPPLG